MDDDQYAQKGRFFKVQSQFSHDEFCANEMNSIFQSNELVMNSVT